MKLILRDVTTGYALGKKGNKEISKTLSITAVAGNFVVLVGPNGSGKSTLFRTIAGLQKPLSGEISIENKHDYLEKNIALVLTNQAIETELTGEEVVSLGRSAHTNWWGTLSKTDSEKIAWAMEMCNTIKFANIKLSDMSDGERQRIFIARALAQDTPIILLDEPTAHLDLPGRIEIQLLLKDLAEKSNKLILMASHDLDISFQLANSVWLMNKAGELKEGIPEDLIISGEIEKVFGTDQVSFSSPETLFLVRQKEGIPVKVSGDAFLKNWTERALKRLGYSVSTHSKIGIECSNSSNKNLWTLSLAGKSHETSSIRGVQAILHLTTK
jgi:iron complex transport system ATP-binding protein